MDCLMLYRNKLDPAINSKEWTKAEEKQLLHLVNTRYGCYNWALIAEDLGTNRTPIECLRHYQQALNNHHINEAPWSEEELQLLSSAVELYGEGKWSHIANCVPGRTVYHCKRAWRKLVDDAANTRSGQWDPHEERLLFLTAVAFKIPSMSAFKKSFEEVQAILKKDVVDSSGHRDQEGIEVDDLMVNSSSNRGRSGSEGDDSNLRDSGASGNNTAVGSSDHHNDRGNSQQHNTSAAIVTGGSSSSSSSEILIMLILQICMAIKRNFLIIRSCWRNL